MSKIARGLCGGMLLAALHGVPAPPAHAQQEGVGELVSEILREVVDRTMDAAREDVRAHTGVDLLERGYARNESHRSFPPDPPAEVRRELQQIEREHDREIAKLEEELHRKLERARAEFRREAAREDKPAKVRQKRRKLERKVQAAYDKFNAKIAAVNARADDKRERVLGKERGRGREDAGGHGEDRGRDRGLEDLTL